MMLRVLVLFSCCLLVMSPRGGAGAIARPWRAGARARDLSRRARKRSPAVSTRRRSAGRLQSNAAEQVLRFHDGAVNAVAFLPDGRIVTAGEDARIAIWRAGRAAARRGARRAHRRRSSALAVSPDGAMLASASWDHTRAAMAARGWRTARARGPYAERQRRRLHARRPRAGERRATMRRCASGRLSASGSADRDDAAGAAQYSRGRARRRDRHRRRRWQGLFACRRRASCKARSRRPRRRSSRWRCRPTAGSSPLPASAARLPSSIARRASSSARWSDPGCRSGRPHSFPTTARCSPAAPTA